MSEYMLKEPVELSDAELDAVAAGQNNIAAGNLVNVQVNDTLNKSLNNNLNNNKVLVDVL